MFISVLMNKDVLWFEISMNKILIMNLEESIDNALSNSRRQVLVNDYRILLWLYLVHLIADWLINAYFLLQRDIVLLGMLLFPILYQTFQSTSVDQFHLDKNVILRVKDLSELNNVAMLQLVQHLLLHQFRLKKVLTILLSHYFQS